MPPSSGPWSDLSHCQLPRTTSLSIGARQANATTSAISHTTVWEMPHGLKRERHATGQ